MGTGILTGIPVMRASFLKNGLAAQDTKSLELSELKGRLVELAPGRQSANLTLLCHLIWQAQVLNEPVAWVSQNPAPFYPPDLSDNGIDLDALAFVRAPTTQMGLRAADHLTRSGAFGLIILDLLAHRPVLQGMLGRLLRIADRSCTALVCLSNKSGCFGSLVSCRVSTRIVAGTRLDVRITKDKRDGPGRRYGIEINGAPGLR